MNIIIYEFYFMYYTHYYTNYYTSLIQLSYTIHYLYKLKKAKQKTPYYVITGAYISSLK